ncbi:hypothetical protein [Nocardia kruczakiae]|uniref:hypothetical protein n=1 Tax=Nocardia kruczakiae TaxID=261477 RepID=UPI0007A47540|nr:hypothetical protein [Nocardia kruczakiae]
MLDRLEWAAESADDPLYEAQAKVKRTRVLIYHDANDTGLRLVEDALNGIEGDSEAANAVRGYAHLGGAIVAARGIRPDSGRTRLSSTARRSGRCAKAHLHLARRRLRFEGPAVARQRYHAATDGQ